MDVALEVLAGLPPAPGHDDAVELVRAHLERTRQERRQAMRASLDSFKPERVFQIVEAEGPDPTDAEALHAGRARLSSRLVARAGGLRAAMDHAGQLYLADRLHAVRISAKKLRYALELAGEAGVAATARAVATLKRAQDLLGRWHDLEIVMREVRVVLANTPALDGRTGRGLETLLRGLERECRRLHASYLTRRPSLERLCARYARPARTAARPGRSPKR
jgi:CHAD domain-containing protein